MGGFTKPSPPHRRESSRQRGWEWRAAAWMARHPGVVLLPGVAGAGLAEIGAAGMAGVAAGAGTGLAAWYRAHPTSYDHLAAPRLRALHRRWLSRYTGRAWQDV